MPQDVIINARSFPLAKAFAFGNVQQNDWLTTFDITSTAPSGDGVYPCGADGSFAADRIILFPYCEGPAPAQFSVRIYGWFGFPSRQAGSQYIPVLLAELLCVACRRSGPPQSPPQPQSPRIIGNTLSSQENLCDTIILSRGQLGPNGLINSTGPVDPATNLPDASQPQTDLIAYAKIDLAGTKFVQFDFRAIDNVAMNCLWAMA